MTTKQTVVYELKEYYGIGFGHPDAARATMLKRKLDTECAALRTGAAGFYTWKQEAAFIALVLLGSALEIGGAVYLLMKLTAR